MKRYIFLILLILSSCESTLLAGMDINGYLDSSAENSMFGLIEGMDIDQDGNLYVADYFNNVIRKITPEGKVSTFAGTGKKGDKTGKKEEAEFSSPIDIKFDNQGRLFVADNRNNKIKMISEGYVSIISDIRHNPLQMLFDNSNKTYIFNGDIYELLSDQTTSLIPDNIIYAIKASINKRTNDIYIINKIGSYNLYTENNIYIKRAGGEFENITKKYQAFPYPDDNPTFITFDDEGNIYISYENGQISKTSKEGKFIRNYSTKYFQFLLFSFNQIRLGRSTSIGTMVIDNNRDILYYENDHSIYKIKI